MIAIWAGIRRIILIREYFIEHHENKDIKLLELDGETGLEGGDS